MFDKGQFSSRPKQPYIYKVRGARALERTKFHYANEIPPQREGERERERERERALNPTPDLVMHSTLVLRCLSHFGMYDQDRGKSHTCSSENPSMEWKRVSLKPTNGDSAFRTESLPRQEGITLRKGEAGSPSPSFPSFLLAKQVRE